jgi:HEAT repeat protein
MGDRLFKLARDVGWLNLVDRNAKTDEPVYAFFHANFQEYFAARAIDDWDYFLPREHNNLNPKPVRNTYQIFEPQWKEVICLWLGREQVSKQHKEEFIKALVEFEDGCWYFYRLRAYLLVAAGIAEFRECSLRDEIVGLIVDWSFLFCYPPSTNIDSEKRISDRGEAQYYGFLPARESYDNLLKWVESGWQKSAPSIKAAREVLKETDRETAISLLVALLESNKNTDWQDIALLLGQIDPSHEIVIPLIVDIIVDDFNEPDFIREMVEELQQIDPCNEAVIAFLVEQILNESLFHGDNIFQAAESLAKLDPGNKRATAHLIKELQTAEHEYNRWLAATSLGKIDLGNKFAIATLESLIESTKKDCRSKEFLTYPGALDKTVGYDLEDFAFFKNLCLLSARSLGEIDPGNEIAISTLIQLIDPNQNEFILDDETRCYVAESLGRIDPGNEKAIAVLIELIQTTEDWETRSEAVSILEQIGTGNEMAIAALVKLIQAADDDAICRNVAESLGKIDPGNETAITALIELILNGWDEDELAANSLEAILQGNHYPKVVTALHHYMTDRVFKDNFFFYHSCHDVIWRCAQNMSYLDFYQAWHGDSPPVQLLENQFTDIASQLQPTAKTYPITINAQALEGETDTSAIAQELCNQIYLSAFPDELEIPEVSNAPQLKRLIPQIKKQLQKQNLALILDKCEPNQAQVTFCRKLSDVLHIAWITNEPIEPPLRGFLPNQPNQLSAIQSWIDEID